MFDSTPLSIVYFPNGNSVGYVTRALDAFEIYLLGHSEDEEDRLSGVVEGSQVYFSSGVEAGSVEGNRILNYSGDEEGRIEGSKILFHDGTMAGYVEGSCNASAIGGAGLLLLLIRWTDGRIRYSD